MKSKLKRQLPNILIGIGIVLLLSFSVYEGINYPWKLLFSEWGWIELSTELPDPALLPASANNGFPADGSNLSDEDALPAQPSWLTTRPPMDITALGSIKLPKIQISENIVEGSGDELFYGVGHIRGTAMPGGEGNCVLAGHRNYVIMHPFRYLDKMEIGDQVYVTDDTNTYTYEVFKIFEVLPDDIWVIQPQEEEDHLLTLLTCTPVIGMTRRLIVWCKLTDTKANV